MTILGIDPGFADMGYGVLAVEGGNEKMIVCGSVRTPAGAPLSERLATIQAALVDLIKSHRPQSAAVERLYFSKNTKTAIAVAEARGVILLTLEQCGVRVVEFNPADVKLAVCGHGAAEKIQVQKMVARLLGLAEPPKPDDAADALALALTLAHWKENIRQSAD